jgi:endonuclease/exonuclease/phosphatase (EEP) superfamily protein YafD
LGAGIGIRKIDLVEVARRPKFTFRGAVRSIFIALSGFYAVSVLALLVVRVFVGESWAIIAALNMLIHMALFPAWLLILPLLFLRRWLLTSALLPMIALSIIWYGPYFLPKNPPEIPPDARLISILSFNTFHDAGELDELVDLIHEVSPDIIALQEFNPLDAEYLTRELSAEYPYQALYPTVEGWGQGVYSRLTITDEYFFRWGRGHQHVELDVGGEMVVVYNSHMSNPLRYSTFNQRTIEVENVLSRAEKDLPAPVIFVGDLNLTDRTDDYQRITDSMNDAFAEIGSGMGFTFEELNIPIVRIDYVFHTDDFRAVEARVLDDTAGSDHRPLFVILALPPLEE